jgi:RHS repeat-associated protein
MMPSYNAETVNYTYSAGNILNTADGNNYTHDANGNRTSKTNGTNTTSYSYDSLNRLVQTVKGPQTTQYIYNGLGQRVGRADNGVQTNYLIDPNSLLPQVLAETDNTGNLIAFYVYDGVGLVAKITPANEYYFYHYDGLGSTVALTNSNGDVVNTYCYSPEGLVGVQETIPNPFTYVGRFGVMAEGNGHYFMRARYYDPEVGRFINKDPIGYAGGLNLFIYTGNNLVNVVDPLGLIPIHEIWLKVEEKLTPLVAAGGFVVGGTVVVMAGGSLAAASPITLPIGVSVVVGGELMIMEGTTIYLNYINANFGTDIPTLSDFYPDLFPRYPVRSKKVKKRSDSDKHCN